MFTPLLASLAFVSISPATVERHLDFLTSDELEGRMTLSKGMHLAADYFAKEFKKYGLQEGPHKGYFHTYETQTNQRATAKNVAAFEWEDGKRTSLAIGKDFVPLVGSTSLKTVTGEVVFLGYGLDDEDWNDFSGVDLNGKVALMLRGVPEGRPFRSSGAKARASIEKGAVGVIFAGPSTTGGAALPPMTRGQGMPQGLESVGVSISGEAFEKATGMRLDEARKAKAGHKALGFRARLITETEPNKGNAINVIGFLPGKDPVLKNEYIIIGAHYDHLGWAETGSRTGVEQIHRGADDNGSGTAGVLAVAEALAKAKANRRTIIFQLYSGEEIGLQGSNAWAKDNPTILSKTTAMLNMDMIGSVRFDSIYVFGTSTSSAWESVLDNVSVPGLNLVYRQHLRGDSDQASFGRRNVPAIFFHSMLTDVYHTEKDTIDKVNMKGAAMVCEAVAATALEVDKRPKLTWNPNANLRGRNDDRVLPTGPGKSERGGE